MKYIVTYDLRKAGQNYDGLTAALNKYPSARPMQSTWFIESTSMAGTIYSDLSQYIDKNDRLFVSEINNNRDGWLSPKDIAFLK